MQALCEVDISTLDKIKEFTNVYHKALEEILETKGRDRFPYHGEATRVVVIYKAKDGYATFYLTPPPRGDDFPSGYLFHDKSDLTLDHICQASTLHRLKVLPADIGKTFQVRNTPPPDIDLPPEQVKPWMINETLLHSIVNRDFDHLMGMAISPIVHIENGTREYIVPSRMKIWSPIADYPKVGRQRFYQWTHADFWWKPENLNIDPSKATEIATNDLIGLEIVTKSEELIPNTARKDTGIHAAEILDSQCNEFMDLIEHSGQYEETLHQWLNDPKHHLFLDPDAKEVRSKVPFGSTVSDFVIHKSDGTYILVEIEPATTPILRKSDQEPTYKFNHACTQVRDWQRYIRENTYTVREELGLIDIYEPKGLVVLGRSGEFGNKIAINRWKDIKNKHEHAIYTYDELCDRVRNLATNLRSILH